MATFPPHPLLNPSSPPTHPTHLLLEVSSPTLKNVYSLPLSTFTTSTQHLLRTLKIPPSFPPSPPLHILHCEVWPLLPLPLWLHYSYLASLVPHHYPTQSTSIFAIIASFFCYSPILFSLLHAYLLQTLTAMASPATLLNSSHHSLICMIDNNRSALPKPNRRLIYPYNHHHLCHLHLLSRIQKHMTLLQFSAQASSPLTTSPKLLLPYLSLPLLNEVLHPLDIMTMATIELLAPVSSGWVHPPLWRANEFTMTPPIWKLPPLWGWPAIPSL